MRWPSIVLEGVDGAGKTYAAKYIMQRDSYAYRHEGVPPAGENPLDYYQLKWEHLSHPAVLDRFIAGQLAYGPVMRNDAKITFEEVYKFCMNNFWTTPEARTLHVLLSPPISQCLLAWNKRNFEGREYVTEYDKFRRVYEAYVDMAKKGLFDIVVCAMTTRWIDDLFNGTLPTGGDVLWVTTTTYLPMTREDFSKKF